MARMTGGGALVEMLRRHQVDTIFALPGVQNDALFVAFYDAGEALRVIHTRHEQGAAYMAFGYARASACRRLCGGAGTRLPQHHRRPRHRVCDERARPVHQRPDRLRSDRPRLRPVARDPRSARDPATADQMGRAHRAPDTGRKPRQ